MKNISNFFIFKFFKNISNFKKRQRSPHLPNYMVFSAFAVANVRSKFHVAVHLRECRHKTISIFASNYPADCYDVDKTMAPT